MRCRHRPSGETFISYTDVMIGERFPCCQRKARLEPDPTVAGNYWHLSCPHCGARWFVRRARRPNRERLIWERQLALRLENA